MSVKQRITCISVLLINTTCQNLCIVMLFGVYNFTSQMRGSCISRDSNNWKWHSSASFSIVFLLKYGLTRSFPYAVRKNKHVLPGKILQWSWKCHRYLVTDVDVFTIQKWRPMRKRTFCNVRTGIKMFKILIFKAMHHTWI
jgi:hypothetical protein